LSENSEVKLPRSQGLYDPANEKDGCGIGVVADILGRKTHRNVVDALAILSNLRHRGAQGADARSGDGCGILTQIPDRLFRAVLPEVALPPAGRYGVGMIFLPPSADHRKPIEEVLARIFAAEGLAVLTVRDVPTNRQCLGDDARESAPLIRQYFLEPSDGQGGADLERKLYVVRRLIEKEVRKPDFFAIPSFSCRKIVYKGLFLPEQLAEYFPDFAHKEYESAIAMVHSRFSTNTFPSWALAHPYRYLCHNGEINTLKGNLNWMSAREKNLVSSVLGGDLDRVRPIIESAQSDSACLDNMVEFLVMAGRSLPHAMAMLLPEPWVGRAMDERRRDFYEYHASIMEPWDGPAAICFTDGEVVGATLDRNGLRPCRYQITNDDRLILSSEAGVLPVDPMEIREKGRLEPGKMLLVDTVRRALVRDDEIKSALADARPYRSWLSGHRVDLADLPEPRTVKVLGPERRDELLRAFGYTEEEFTRVLEPMARTGEEPISSMGMDTPLAVLSERPQPLFNYFRQLFAQVTNPPIDPIREALVMSLTTFIGPKADPMSENPEACRRVKIPRPILTNTELRKIRDLTDPEFQTRTLDMLFEIAGGAAELESAIDTLTRSSLAAVRGGCRFLVLSDRGVSPTHAAIPSLLAVSAVGQALIRAGLRTAAGLIVETGEAREIHHFACLIGFGAGAVNPYLALESIDAIDPGKASAKYVQALGKGLLKIFSKMGISTVQSYCGAQIFQALGVHDSLLEKYFTGTASSKVGGIDIRILGEECLRRHALAYDRPVLSAPGPLESAGEIHFRAGGEHHDWNPDTIADLQSATRTGDARTYRQFSDRMNREHETPTTLRGMLEFTKDNRAVPLFAVEPAAEIVKRFTTGAMSLGAISEEAHQTLAVAMNRIGAKSNTGEGGEDPARFLRRPSGDSANSAIKQVASARFGVTIDYLVNADEIQIKMAQGAKPGEGGQLPGHKVDDHIARLRFSTPGVSLISPPPHHDIYSIEDLAQLIYDLRNANPRAAISVKLVAEAGVGVVAAGVAKAGADKILISGDTGGTGASPLSSIQSAGAPWELGLAESHQTLLLNGLRSKVRVETDGQLRTGRDVAIAALLGAEEFGFATAPLIVEGCVMMRKCHLNTCPVGIATQDPTLRAKFAGRPEHVINYFFFVAEELREIMAMLGFRTIDEMVGRTDRLQSRRLPDHWKASRVDLAPLLHRPDPEKYPFSRRESHDRNMLAPSLGQALLARCAKVFDRGGKVAFDLPIQNVDRAVGTYLAGKVTKKFGRGGLPEDSIVIRFTGSAGQSFGAFACAGITLRLEGEANDYLGKGLSGGRLVIAGPARGGFDIGGSILIGNTALYGATSGEVFIAGRAGERFAVRNSGASAVVEGVGDHGCEYMTGGTVAVLGETGVNFAAGMSGGIAYVYDENGDFNGRCNLEMVAIEPLETERDEIALLALIRAHLERTGSEKAHLLLADWKTARAKFRKVIPTEYRAILARRLESEKLTEVVHG
jgi:glutamate synthase (NADPH/NADH) large chain